MVNAISALEPPPMEAISADKPLALFLDFDGTLVELAHSPDAIELAERLAARLEALSERLGGRLAIVSGRSLENITSHLGHVRLARAGSHGMERRFADDALLGERPEPMSEKVIARCEAFAAAHEGMLVERKAHGVALHYRGNPSAGEEAIAFAEELSNAEGLAVKLGKCVVELVEPGADKAGAVRAFMEGAPFAGALPVFLGDDITDEDGFRAAEELGGFGILVGDRSETLARYRLATVGDVHEWLRL